MVSITGREKENSGESWWRLLVVLLLLPVSDLLPVTTIGQILGSDTRMKWNKREKNSKKTSTLTPKYFWWHRYQIFEIFRCCFSHLMLDVPLISLLRLTGKWLLKGCWNMLKADVAALSNSQTSLHCLGIKLGLLIPCLLSHEMIRRRAAHCICLLLLDMLFFFFLLKNPEISGLGLKITIIISYSLFLFLWGFGCLAALQHEGGVIR